MRIIIQLQYLQILAWCDPIIRKCLACGNEASQPLEHLVHLEGVNAGRLNLVRAKQPA